MFLLFSSRTNPVNVPRIYPKTETRRGEKKKKKIGVHRFEASLGVSHLPVPSISEEILFSFFPGAHQLLHLAIARPPMCCVASRKMIFTKCHSSYISARIQTHAIVHACVFSGLTVSGQIALPNFIGRFQGWLREHKP